MVRKKLEGKKKELSNLKIRARMVDNIDSYRLHIATCFVNFLKMGEACLCNF